MNVKRFLCAVFSWNGVKPLIPSLAKLFLIPWPQKRSLMRSCLRIRIQLPKAGSRTQTRLPHYSPLHSACELHQLGLECPHDARMKECACQRGGEGVPRESSTEAAYLGMHLTRPQMVPQITLFCFVLSRLRKRPMLLPRLSSASFLSPLLYSELLKLNDFNEMSVPAARTQLLKLTNVASSLCLAS